VKDSPAKNHPGEECSGEEFSASGDFFRAKNSPAKNYPGEESSERKTFRRRIFRAKNTPAKNFPPLQKNNCSEEYFGEEFSALTKK
jgi:hypothetical protein